MPEIITTFLISLIAAIIGHIITQPIVDILWERYRKDFQKAGDESLGEKMMNLIKRNILQRLPGLLNASRTRADGYKASRKSLQLS